MSGNTQSTPYRIGAAIAVAAGLLQVWMNVAVGIVGSEENPTNLGFFMVVASAAACAFTARFRAEGMVRAMIATAALQAMLGVVIATAPVNADDAMPILGLSGSFALLWLLAAALFHRSTRASDGPALA